MRQYYLKIWQKKEIDNATNYLQEIIIGDDDCANILNAPRPKSIQNKFPENGMKWVDGSVSLNNTGPCLQSFTTRIVNDEYFKIWIKRINSRN